MVEMPPASSSAYDVAVAGPPLCANDRYTIKLIAKAALPAAIDPAPKRTKTSHPPQRLAACRYPTATLPTPNSPQEKCGKVGPGLDISSSDLAPPMPPRPGHTATLLTTGKRRYRRQWVAGGLGFEPRLTESESAVLPLNYPPKPSRLTGRLTELGCKFSVSRR
jgi:hypothetical protein